MSWLQSLLYGLISGAAEFLPISAEAHRALYLKLVGAGDDPAARLAVHIGAVLAVLFSCGAYLRKLTRERRIAAIPKRKRKRQPDLRSILDIRLLQTAAIPVLLWFAAYPFVYDQGERLWILALLLIANGIILFVPRFFTTANKDSRALSGLDGLLLGLFAGAGSVPGISRMGSSLSGASLRGADRQFALDFALLLFLPAGAALIGFDLYYLVTAGGAFSLWNFLGAAAAAFAGGCGSIYTMRFLAVKSDVSGFAYYSWGAALFALVLYLVA